MQATGNFYFYKQSTTNWLKNSIYLYVSFLKKEFLVTCILDLQNASLHTHVHLLTELFEIGT